MPRFNSSLLASSILIALTFAPLAAAQAVTQTASADPAQQPAPTPAPPAVYTPTSLTPEPGLPRTPDGHPDFQDAVWATNFFPVFDASPLASTLVVSEAEAKKMVDTMVAGMASVPGFQIDPEAHELIGGTDGLPIVRGERRSRLIVLPANGKLPMSPEAKKMASGKDIMDGAKDDYEQRPTGERCLVLSGNPPVYSILAYNRLQVVQTPTHIVIHNETGDEARIIPFPTQHKAPGPKSWFGDSIARWEGDTLVVETIRQNPKDNVRGLMTKFVVSEDAKVIERFTRVSKAELLYQFTIEDPKVYTAPWLGEFSFFTTTTGMFPSACHEHNYSLPNILSGARVIEARAAGKAY